MNKASSVDTWTYSATNAAPQICEFGHDNWVLALAAALILSASSDLTPVNPGLVDPRRLHATVLKLSSMHDRNTNNLGLEEAAGWVLQEFRKINGLQSDVFRYHIEKGPRVPIAKDVAEVVAILPGETDRRVIIGGHLDSINMAETDWQGRAPGANDDASGVSLTLELARLMSTKRWKQTLVFVAFSGEEQGLLGSSALAKRAREEHWKIDAVLNNDIVGGSSDLHGHHDNRVRVFSEESPEHNSRELARYTAYLADPSGSRRDGGGVELVLRPDRFGRGGDHTPFNQQGFTAIRFVDSVEEYARQHTPKDEIEAMDFGHLANVARLNLRLAESLALADLTPTQVRVSRKQSKDSTITWQASPDTRYVLYSRLTTSPVWTSAQEVPPTGKVTVPVDKDDHVFAIGALGGIPVEAK